MTPEPALDVRLDHPIPRELAVGGGAAVFVSGSCFSPTAGIRSLDIVADGVARPTAAHGMPRLDLFRALHPTLDPFATADTPSDPASDEDPYLRSYRSGFWGLARFAADGRDPHSLALHAVLDDGREVTEEVASLTAPPATVPPELEAPAPGDGPLVAICMATYDPPPDLFRRQLESIRSQTHRNWVCVISDDCSPPERFAALEHEVGDDPRFAVSRSSRRRGFYGNFERALALAPPAAEYVAMADQDDDWHPDKLATLMDALGDAELVYSDQRVISPSGELLADTYWSTRRNNHTDITSLLVANSVTGAASLFPRRLLDDVLPFPPAQFAHFHDHWIALVALSLGDIAFVDRPLYDYVQHDGAVLGHAAANRVTALRDRLGRLGDNPRERIGRWRMHYFVDNQRLAQIAAMLEMRVGDRTAPAKRRALARITAADRSPLALGRLAARAIPELVGRQPETLGAEVGLSLAFLWRGLLRVNARGDRPRRTLRLDSVPPPNLAPRPGRKGPDAGSVRTVADKIAPLELAVRDDAPVRVNLLVPTIDLKHLFGGYIAKFNLARRLAERGHRVRIVTVDPVGPLPRDWRDQLESYAGLGGLRDTVEVAFGRESQGIEVNRGDRFVATTWWSAHIAAAALPSVQADSFTYLIQEYEPFTFAMGTWAALAAASYELPHTALFSTELLRDYFRQRQIGVFSGGANAGDAASLSFQNAITAVDPPAAAELAARSPRRLLFYARPEQHAARNMYELGLLALDRALATGAFAGWELHGIGTVEAGRRIALGGGASLELLPRSAQTDYADVLRAHDVGLALMYTPHPSLVPIEMASAGMLCVTNSFENKTPAAMAAISPNLLAAQPGIESIAAALCDAAVGAEDTSRRVAGARVAWSRDWAESFPDGLVDRLLELQPPR